MLLGGMRQKPIAFAVQIRRFHKRWQEDKRFPTNLEAENWIARNHGDRQRRVSVRVKRIYQ